MARKAKRQARRAASDRALVQLVTPDRTIELAWPAPETKEVGKLQHHAIQWTHVVRNRARWIGTPALAEQEDAHAREFLALLGITEDARRQLAAAGTIRVSIAFTDENHGWEARILPWEFVLPAGTRDLRTGPLVVTRSLLRERAARGAASYRKALFVESAPGRLAQDWDFKDERKLVERYTKPAKVHRLASPTRAALRAAVTRIRPDIVHFAGFDTHQGLELVNDPDVDDTVDGYLLATEGGRLDPVPAADLADILTPGAFAPSLVFCNLWNSAARVAPLLVAAGAHAVIGFQDGIDDALAEIFLGNFYQSLTGNGDLHAAFQDGLASLQTEPKPLRATGIVLWEGAAPRPARTLAARPSTRPREERTIVPEEITFEKARGYLAITVEPEPQFSYGLLHNDRDLFRRFLIRNLSNAPISGLQVFVELHTNEGTYPYRQSFAVDGPVLDLSRHVRIALTSDLARTLDEVLRTSLYVQVSWGPHEVFRQTFPITMAPVDQWADTDNDRIFLPSFIFPRDRAVATVIRNAEHFVTALRDDPTAGFDGYQSIDRELPNPAENVDRQVQALWYSVVYRVPASYINPPPTYAVASQRIRTPSEIVSGGFGTCIDLALMLASCLEAIEIYPVIFLLHDHAFPGYWRTDAARAAFCRRVASSAGDQGSVGNAIRGDGASAKRRPGAPWCYDSAALPEIKRAIDGNQLVPLESVGLTGRWSFGDAAVEGRTYFEPDQADRFLLMLDVMTARERRVTPLPLGSRLQ